MHVGFVMHRCDVIGRELLLPVTADRYNAKVIAQARCAFCAKDELDSATVDRSVAPSKGFYITA